MKSLLLHAKEFCYRPVKPAIKEYRDEVKEGEEKCFENALVVFVTVEDQDSANPKGVVSAAVDDIVKHLERVKASSVIIYPYAHLSPRLAPPHVAVKVLRLLEEELSSACKVDVHRAPFGWYKEFKLHCYGHPLAELSRTYTAPPERRSYEKKYLVLTPDGKVYEPEEFLEKADPELRILIEKEALGKELGEAENPVTRLAGKFGFEWEPYSDYGHMRYEPHAALMLEAVARYSWLVAQRLGIPVLRVHGTNMFDLSIKAVREHAELFSDRLYDIWADKKHLILRYAACHQQFAILKDYILSYRDLPLGMFEVADSYRFEQPGELLLSFRLRKFHMPDLHILTKDVDEAIKIVREKVQPVIHEEASKLGRSYVALYNVTSSFWEERFNDILEFVKRDGRPALVSIIPPLYYWVINVEYHIIDAAGRPREIATFQIDIGNAKRFGIKYVDSEDKKRHPVIIHTALIGSIERYIYMVLDTAVQEYQKGRTPSIPVWLSPIQVRVIPVKPHDEQLAFAEEVLNKLLEAGVRADIDDRDISLGRRIRDAAREWIPFIAVIGSREVETKTINLTVRKTNDRLSVTIDELLAMLRKEIKGYPLVEQTLPVRVSQRPTLAYLEKSVFSAR